MVNLFEIDSTFLHIEVVLAELSRGIYLQVTVSNHGHKASSEGTKIVKGLPVLVNHTPLTISFNAYIRETVNIAVLKRTLAFLSAKSKAVVDKNNANQAAAQFCD